MNKNTFIYMYAYIIFTMTRKSSVKSEIPVDDSMTLLRYSQVN